MLIAPILVVAGVTIISTVVYLEDEEDNGDKNVKIIERFFRAEELQINGIYPKFAFKEKEKWGTTYYFELPPTLPNQNFNNVVDKLQEGLERKVVLIRDEYGKLVIQIINKRKEKEFEEFKKNFGCTKNLSCEISTKEVTCNNCHCKGCHN